MNENFSHRKSLYAAMKKPTKHTCMPNKYADINSVEQALRPLLSRLRKISFLKTPCYVLAEDENTTDKERGIVQFESNSLNLYNYLFIYLFFYFYFVYFYFYFILFYFFF